MPKLRRPSVIATAALSSLAVAGMAGAATPGSITGPSSSDAPYLVRQVPGVTFTSILSAPDSVGGYRMSGTPDGLGAFDNGDGTYTVLMNHEFGPTVGTVRAHGATGSYVSRYVIDKETQEVLSGSDQIKRLVTSGSQSISRLCSADLADKSAFWNAASGKGYDGRIFLNGEENGAVGRAFANIVENGVTYELPAIGKAGWENLAANPSTGDTTTVVGQSDGGTQNVYVYSGTKQSSGDEIDRAGLANGTSRSISVSGLPVESGSQPVPDGAMPFTLAAAGAGTVFDRPEDGAWDTQDPNVYYFVTTAAINKHSRLWKVTFKDAADPAQGGSIERILEGPTDLGSGPHMMDNLTVNSRGQLIVQEDVGGNTYLGGVYQVDPATGGFTRIAQHDPARFLPGGAGFDTIDEESSGVIPAPFLGEGKYLLDVQNHKAYPDPEIVEKGQLLLMTLPPGRPIIKE